MGLDAAMVWLKVMHFITLLTWSAGLLYLPGLFIAHTRPMDRDMFQNLRHMTRFVYVGITSPAAILAIVSGTALVFLLDDLGGWLPLKLTAVALMMVFHIFCGYLMTELQHTPLAHKTPLYLALLLIPSLLITVVLWLVLAKPL